MNTEFNSDYLYINGVCDSGLNVWFTHYVEARDYFDKKPGCYLLPYRHHFFVCRAGHIEKLGIDPQDPDWTEIGFDWSRPLDMEARGRLEKKILNAMMKSEAISGNLNNSEHDNE